MELLVNKVVLHGSPSCTLGSCASTRRCRTPLPLDCIPHPRSACTGSASSQLAGSWQEKRLVLLQQRTGQPKPCQAACMSFRRRLVPGQGPHREQRRWPGWLRVNDVPIVVLGNWHAWRPAPASTATPTPSASPSTAAAPTA